MEKEKKTNTFEDKDKLIARFQKLAKAINKYDPSYDKVLDLDRVRGYNPKSITYEKLMAWSPEDPLWITLSRVYYNEPQYQRIILYYATLFLNYYYVSPVDLSSTGRTVNKKKLEKEYNDVLAFLDDEIKVEDFTVRTLIDILVDGKFEEDLKDISLKFRGSRNQRIIDMKKSKEKGQLVLSDLNK